MRTLTEAGLRNNVSVAIQYLATWLKGSGAVGIFNLMEDAATAEIARAQLWQWLHVGGQVLDDGSAIDFDLFDACIAALPVKLARQAMPGEARIEQAAWMLAELTHARELCEFLTLPAYELLP